MMYRKFVDTGKSVEIITYSIQNGVSKDDPEIIIPYPAELSKCPFCGGDAEIKSFSMYGFIHGMKVQCKNCHCGTTPKNDAESVTGIKYTLQECLDKVVALWNHRTA